MPPSIPRDSAKPAQSETTFRAAAKRAAPRARDGDPEPIHLEETDSSFAIGWEGQYRIEGSAFIYADRDSGRVRTIIGDPTQKIARAG